MTAAAGALSAGAIGAAAASVGLSAYSAITQVSAAKSQRIVDESAINLKNEQAKFQAEEQALLHTTNFRKSLASQLAIAGMRGGAGSIATQLGQESLSNLNQDLTAIQRGARLADVQSSQARAESRGRVSATKTTAITQFGKSTLDTLNMNEIFGKKKKPTTEKGGS